MNFSDYIVYMDESGDHGMESIHSDYPVFMLVFCLFKKSEYSESISPAVQQLKFKYFGHDQIVLHEREIRKAAGPFKFLINAEKRNSFLSDVSSFIEQAPFSLVAVIIDKIRLKEKHGDIHNPYDLALKQGLKRIESFLETRCHAKGMIHIVAESRGRRNDNELELEFRRILDKGNRQGEMLFDLIFADKKSNSCGLQLADLIARPIGRHFMNPNQSNHAYEIIRKKFLPGKEGKAGACELPRLP